MSSPTGNFRSVHDAHDPAAARALHGSAWARFSRGVGLGFPIFLGYLPVGMAFGIIAATLGFTPFAAALCSATALAGAGQLIALQFLGNGSAAFGVLLATTVVNLRYVLFASTMSTYLRGVSLPTQAGLSFSLTDETFAVNIADHRAGLATPASMAGVGAIAWAGWVIGTLVGAIGTHWIGDPSRFGVQFAMPAMFTALFVALAEEWRHVACGLLAAALVAAVGVLGWAGVHIDPSWALLLSAIGAATIAAAVRREG
jgi:4-azaleucine resistance transporter AzlC